MAQNKKQKKESSASKEVIFTNASTSVMMLPVELDTKLMHVGVGSKKIKLRVRRHGTPRTMLKPGQSTTVERDGVERLRKNHLWDKIFQQGIVKITNAPVTIFKEEQQKTSEPTIPDELLPDSDPTSILPDDVKALMPGG